MCPAWICIHMSQDPCRYPESVVALSRLLSGNLLRSSRPRCPLEMRPVYIAGLHAARSLPGSWPVLCEVPVHPLLSVTHRRTGEHPFGGSNRVLPEWRTQLVCHAAPPGRKNNDELTQCLFLTVIDEPMNVSFVTPPEMYLR